MSRFQKATRKKLKLRLALCGPTGSGKTLTALKVAAHLGQRIAVIDTENRSASKYVGVDGVPAFDVLELETYSPKVYVDAIRDAEREGYDVIVIDGISQAWSGKDGALEQVDKAAKRSQSGNTFMAWRDVTPLHNQFVDAMVHCKAHLIVTMRVKTEWVLEENERGKKVPRKVGMAVEQRAGLEYEVDVVGDLDIDHNLMISKTRCAALDGAVIHRPGRDLAEKLLAWLDEGEGAPVAAEQPQPKPAQTTEAVAQTGVTAEPALDIEWWLRQHNDLCDRAFNAAGIVSGPQDAHGLHVPSMEAPKFSAQARKYAGLAFDDEKVPAGYLREVIWSADNFAKQKPDVRLWVSYLVARHEIRKLEAVAMAAEAGFVPDPAAQAAADGEAAQ